MIILEEHFKRGTTFFIGKYIINGCQAFTIDELGKVCKKYNVPNEIKENVNIVYNHNLSKNDNLIELAKHGDNEIREIIAKINNYDTLNILKYDKNKWVRRQASKHNNIDILNFLKYDIDYFVRYQVAKHYNPEILEYLKNDKHIMVRIQAKQTLEENK